MMENKEEIRESQKDLSNKFLDIIFNSVQNLQDFETCMNQGCLNLIEYMQSFNINHQNPNLVNYLRLKNMDLMVQEFSLLLPNIKNIVQEDEMEKLEARLEIIKSAIVNGVENKKSKKVMFISKETANHKNRTKGMILLGLFDLIGNQLSQLRAETIDSLSSVLFSQKGKPRGRV